MKGQTYIILFILFTILISVFAVLNTTVVRVNYLFWQGSSPLILVILFSVLLGAILTMIAGSKKYLTYKKQTKQLQMRVAELESQSTISTEEISDLNLDADTEVEQKDDFEL